MPFEEKKDESKEVSTVSWGNEYFTVRSGEYEIRYHKEKTNGFIFIYNLKNSGNKVLVTNFGLDNAALEILTNVSEITVTENNREITIQLKSRREWADFTIRIRFFKNKPGLINWKVDLSTKGREGMQKVPYYRFFPQVSAEGWGLTTDQEIKFYDTLSGKFISGKGIDYLRGTADHKSAWGLRNVYNQFCYLHEEEIVKSTILYFQNFSSLNKYYDLTKTDAAYTVDLSYPWISYYPTRRVDFDHKSFNNILKFGYKIPISEEIPPDVEVTILDSFLYLVPVKPENNMECCELFLKMFSEIYDEINKPETTYIDWATEIVPKEIENLLDPENWITINGKQYLKSYVKDSRASNAELITLLDVLVPLKKYYKKFGKGLDLIEKLENSLQDFFKPGIDGEEGCILQSLILKESRKPLVLDAWYFVCPILWTSHLAEENPVARKMVLDSRNIVTVLGRKVSYVFPQFVDILTGEYYDIIGTGKPVYEYDVTGVYAYLMLQYYRLTGDKKFLEEAEKAIEKIAERGFEYTYEMTATPEGAVAALMLYQLTNNEKYLKISYIPLANIVRHSVFFECKYGYGKHFRTFFSTMAMPESYVAACEEGKVFRYIVEYITKGEKFLPKHVKKLMAELLKYKGQYTMPPEYPKEMIAEKTACGESVPSWYIPFEDLMFGWKKSGQVGQEIYGAGYPIEIATGLYNVFNNGKVILYTEYPLTFYSEEKGKVIFKVSGTEEYSFKARIIYLNEKNQPSKILQLNEDGKAVKEVRTNLFDGKIQEFTGHGDTYYMIVLN
ncbi:MAG: hypothetical protein QXN53_04045 [Thermoproteota archaeon]